MRVLPLALALGCKAELDDRPAPTSAPLTDTTTATTTTSTSSSTTTTTSTTTSEPWTGDCHAGWNVPPTHLPLWAPVLSGDGALTLTTDAAHGHDDGLGPVGWCPADDTSGRYLALVAARFETDQQPPHQPCVVDPWAVDPTHDTWGACWSSGNHNVYVEVLDASGARVVADLDLWWPGGLTEVSDQDKPPHEFPINAALWGGGQYGVTPRFQGLPAESVTNLRIPLNHHVNYLLTFQVVDGAER